MVFARAAAVERAMTMQAVILRVLSGSLTWLQVADILGIHPRSLRRWRARYQADRVYGLFDRRHRPSWRRAPLGDIERIVRLYRERYGGFNIRHFHHLARRDHGVTYSYSFVRLALQTAGLVRKGRARGRHRRRREPRPCFGELVHLDGSRHAWLPGAPAARQTLIAILDDATKRLRYAQLGPAETTEAVMGAVRDVVTTFGLPLALYTDRAGWAFHTPKAGGKVDPSQPTQLGRALARLGIEHIPSYSPQARGRSERLNRTLQGRLGNELRLHGCTTLEAANRYLVEHFIPDYNAQFTRPPRDPVSAFAPLGDADLDLLLCHEETRTVGLDNVVTLEGVPLQVAKQPGRRTCAGLRVTVRRHLDGRHTVWQGPRCLGRYDAAGRRLEATAVPSQTVTRAHGARRRPPARPHAPDALTGPPRRRRRGPRLPIGPGD